MTPTACRQPAARARLPLVLALLLPVCSPATAPAAKATAPEAGGAGTPAPAAQTPIADAPVARTPAAPPASPTPRFTFEAARKLFRERGVQPGEALPPLSLVDLHGKPADLAVLRADRPLLLVTCSLTCNVARRRQAEVELLRDRFGDRLAVVMLYTIEAHPQGDPCPYTGAEWVPPDNRQDGVLVRQPTSLADRLALAHRYAEQWARSTMLLVDTFDDASWKALGEAPNLGLLVDRTGTVRERQGWFDHEAMAAAVAKLLP